MKEQLISFKTAKLAKEKGLDIPNSGYYYNKKGDKIMNNLLDKFLWGGKYSVSTQSLLQKWLREEKGIVILLYLYDRDREDIFSYEIIRRINILKCETPYLSYEKALEKGLQKALKLIK